MIVLLASACSEPPPPPVSHADLIAAMQGFADDVVATTYGEFAAESTRLAAAVEALRLAPTAPTLAAARSAWLAARAPWEAAESFLIGPVVAFALDPALDTWPVSELEIDALIAGEAALTIAAAADWPTTQKGFHGLGYVLFGIDGSRTAAALTPRQLQYAEVTAQRLAADAERLRTSWDEPFNGGLTYRELFFGGGAADNQIYPTPIHAVAEIIAGMSGVIGEIEQAKLGVPFYQQNADLLESRYSQSSLADFSDNLEGVIATYLGYATSVPASARQFDVDRPSVAAIVHAIAPELHAELMSKMQACLAAIAAIDEPYNQTMLLPETAPAIEAAIAAHRELRILFDGRLAVAFGGISY